MQRHLVLITMILLGIAAAGVACHRHKNPLPPPEEAVLPDSPPAAWATDGDQDAGPVARPMPSKPFSGQKRAPCSKDEVEIRGACWAELARKPETDGCGSIGFVHEGRCYVPVQKAQRPPTSYGE